MNSKMWIIFLTIWVGLCHAQLEIPCVEFHPNLDLPCLCGLNEVNATKINCDGAVFVEFLVLPHRFYIQEFSQRQAGLQTLGAQLFTASDIPLKVADFSDNQVRRLTERLFDGVEDTLEVILLGNNLLGDNLNPVFSSGEFQNLKFLRHLDLSYNHFAGIEEGLLEGCTELKDLKFNGNKLTRVPTEALKGPESLQNLQLQDNLIDKLTPLAFETQPKLLSVNLTNNLITDIQKGTFVNMTRLVRLILTRNRIKRIEDTVLSDLTNLVELDISFNFLDSIPVNAIRELKNIKFLNLASNRIQAIREGDLQYLKSLEYLDLSRNLIGEIMPATFLAMSALKGLDFSVNGIRKVEDDAFEGLQSLEYLDMSDNKVLSLPAAALGRLPNLRRLKADYNRIGALSYDILRSVQGLEELSLAYNIIREIPEGTFKDMSNLKILNLYGNQIVSVSRETFFGTEENLEYLDLGFNIISKITEIDFPALKYLNLERNLLQEVEGAFGKLSNVNVLVLKQNQIRTLTPASLSGLENLISIDISDNRITEIGVGVFANQYLNEVNISGNVLKELGQQTFSELPILEILDLSRNSIIGVKNGAFDNIPRLKKLFLSHNRMSSYRGDFFSNTGNETDLHTLDVSHNELTYLYPESFSYHPYLRFVDFSQNKFSFFPTQFIKGLSQLETLDLSSNLIKSVDEGDFANLPKLRKINLSNNEVSSISESGFQNSSQLQDVNLSHNLISELKSDTFSGLVRLLLDLSNNNLTGMPKAIFERRKVAKLQSLNLAHNRFESVPVDVLQSQYFFLDTLIISNNRISSIPSDANILVNIKEIDLSFNPLSEESIKNVLNEPKTVRRLNMAGTGILTVPILETPFLTHLNISHNAISVLNEEILNKPSLLSLDVSHNDIPNLSFGLTSAWTKLRNLKYLDISYNPITFVIKGDFKYLDGLEVLKMAHLEKCNKIETGSFSNLKAIREFQMFGLPKITFVDIRGILSNFELIESVQVEFKDSLIGDHLSPAYSPRLRKLGVSGPMVDNIAIGAFAGITSQNLDIMIRNTNITNIPTAIFFPVPMSSRINLDVRGSRLSSLSPQLLNTLDSKQRHIRLEGLATNPIFCDCNARALGRWLKDKYGSDAGYDDLAEVRCAAPDILAGKLLANLPEEELTCEGRTTTTTTELEFLTERISTTSEPDIITGSGDESTSSATTQNPKLLGKGGNPQAKQATPYNMDALIIGIVGGVVIFIAIIIIIICVVRLRLTDSQYRGGPLAGPLALRAQGKCTCLKPVPPTLYGAASLPPPPPPGMTNGGYLSYPSTPVAHHHARGPPLALTWAGNGTVNSQKMLPPPANSINGYGTVGAHSYLSAGTVVSRGSHHPLSYPGTLTPHAYPPTPYYVTFPADSDGEAHSQQHSGRDSGHR